jgi:NAD(P)-dependent dehydrogenase (short-subunit alcohol dehydrogenase family)
MGERLKGKVAIVTGAGSVIGVPDRPPVGNGKAAAIVYAMEAATVMVVDLNIDAAEETRRAIQEKGGICSVFRADVTRAEDCRAMAEQCVKTYGRIDILHNNVGIGGKFGGILDVDGEDWDTIMNGNVKSMFHTCKAVVPHMLNGGGGSILNISSAAAVNHSFRMLFLYGISKAAVNSFTRYLASQFADKGIRVNGIMPGLIDTPMIYYKQLLPSQYGGDIERMRKERNERVPMKRMGEPWDIAYAALFLVSDEAKYITGQIIAVDGGMLLGAAVG